MKEKVKNWSINIPMKMNLVKKVTSITAIMLVVSSLSTWNGYADSIEGEVQPVSSLENVLATEEVEGISTDVKLSEEVLSEDFDLEEAVANMPSIQEMTVEEKQLFDEIVEEQVLLQGLDEEAKKVYEEALVNFFDETSDTYQNLELAQEELVTEIQEVASDDSAGNISAIEQVTMDTFGVSTASAAVQVKE